MIRDIYLLLVAQFFLHIKDRGKLVKKAAGSPTVVAFLKSNRMAILICESIPI